MVRRLIYCGPSQIAVPEVLHFGAGRQQIIEPTRRFDVPVFEDDDVIGAA